MRTYEWKSALMLGLLVMVLMRLVWMDLRSYVIIYAPQNRLAFASLEQNGHCIRSAGVRQSTFIYRGERASVRPGWAEAWSYQTLLRLSCSGGRFSEAAFIRYNQGLLVALLVSCVILTRLISRSWILGALIAVALLSRGRLIAANGHVAAEHLLALGLVVWGLGVAHGVRSGSPWAMAIQGLALAWLLPLEPSFALLILLVPLGLWVARSSVWRKSWDQHILTGGECGTSPCRRLWPWRDLIYRDRLQGRSPRDGALFQPHLGGVMRALDNERMRQPLWHSAWAIVGAILFGLLLLGVLGQFPLPARWTSWTGRDLVFWWMSALQPLDRDLSVCLALICMALGLRSPWLQGFRSLLALSCAALLLQTFGTFLLDAWYLPRESARLWLGPRILLWWEPLLLTLGILAFYQFVLHVLPSLLGRIFWSRSDRALGKQDAEVKGEKIDFFG